MCECVCVLLVCVCVCVCVLFEERVYGTRYWVSAADGGWRVRHRMVFF